MNTKYYLEYDGVDLSVLKEWEREVIEIFKDVTKICGDIYSLQKDSAYDGSNFYPHDITREEIEDISRSNPLILSPFTIVKRQGADLVAVPYSKEYADYIKNIVTLIKKASMLYSSNGFDAYTDYLVQFTKDLQSDNYEESERKWLKLNGNINVDIRLGPLETYLDKFLGIKRAFQSNVRVLNKNYDPNLEDFINVVNILQPSNPIDKTRNEVDFRVRIDNIICVGGWHAELKPVGSNYPRDEDYFKYGAKILIYSNSLSTRHIQVAQVAKEILNDEFTASSQGVPVSVKFFAYHEIAETIIRIRNHEYNEKLLVKADLIRELYSDLLGIKSASILVLKGVMTDEEFRNLISVYISSGLLDNQSFSAGKDSAEVYALGFRMVFNYLIENKAIIVNNSNVNVIYEMFFPVIEELMGILNDLMTNGTPEKAELFYNEFSTDKYIKTFESALKKYLI